MAVRTQRQPQVLDLRQRALQPIHADPSSGAQAHVRGVRNPVHRTLQAEQAAGQARGLQSERRPGRRQPDGDIRRFIRRRDCRMSSSTTK